MNEATQSARPDAGIEQNVGGLCSPGSDVGNEAAAAYSPGTTLVLERDATDGSSYYVFSCPVCGGGVCVPEVELNCKIFRHGTVRATGQPLDPHAPREVCERLVSDGAVLGCARPFRVVAAPSNIPGETATIIAVPCDYI